MANVLTQAQETRLVTEFNNGMKNKTHLGLRYGISARTVGRILERHAKQIGKVAAPTPVAQTVAVTFQKGDRVRLENILMFKSKEDKYTVSESNTVGNVGTVNSADEAWVNVTWDNGSVNSYNYHNLKHIVEEVVQPVEVAHVITPMSVVLSVAGNIQVIDFTHPSFDKVKQLIAAGDFAQASLLMDIKKAIEMHSEGMLKIVKGEVTYNGVPVEHALAKKIVGLMELGDEGYKGFAKFMAKVMENPSLKTRERLMDFAAAEDIKISAEGDLVCYKNVKHDFRPSRAGVWTKQANGEWKYDKEAYYDNSVGNVLEMPRTEVDDEESNTCSRGLHVMSLSYAKSFWGTSGHNLVVHVNPADFVAIPPDYNNSKARVCKYTVVRELDAVELKTLMAMV